LKEKKLIKNKTKKKQKKKKKEVKASGLEAAHEAWAFKKNFIGQTINYLPLNLF
jgi:hypothetical protein